MSETEDIGCKVHRPGAFLREIVRTKVLTAPDEIALEGAVAYCVGYMAALEHVGQLTAERHAAWEQGVRSAEDQARERLAKEKPCDN